MLGLGGHAEHHVVLRFSIMVTWVAVVSTALVIMEMVIVVITAMEASSRNIEIVWGHK